MTTEISEVGIYGGGNAASERRRYDFTHIDIENVSDDELDVAWATVDEIDPLLEDELPKDTVKERWFTFVFALIFGRWVSAWLVWILIFLIQKNSYLRKKMLYFVYGLRKVVKYCFWLGFILIVWRYVCDKEDKMKEPDNIILKIVTKILVGLLVSGLIWLLKTIMIEVLASSFHVSAFFDRIQHSLFNHYIIERLSGPSLTAYSSSLASERVITGGNENQGITLEYLMKLNLKNISVLKMKKLMNMVQNRNQLASRKSEQESKSAVRKVMLNFPSPNSSYIDINDLKHFLREDELLKTLSLFEGSSKSKKISKFALRNWVVHSFRGRRALVLTLNDTKAAVKKLHQLVNIIVGAIIVIVLLVVFEFTTTNSLVLIAAQLAVLIFIFGNTCKTVFEAVIFLFGTHPYDVGDLCNIEGVEMVVEKMNILTTDFSRFDNHEKITCPNSVLATKNIGNYRRSVNLRDSVHFFVSIDTPTEKISQLKERIKSYMEEKEYWYPASTIALRDIIEENFNMVRMEVWIRRMNHEHVDERLTRRSQLVSEILRNIIELGIQHHEDFSVVHRK